MFAQSVDEAALPAARWPSQNRDVAYYRSTLQLLQPPAPSAQPQPAMDALEQQADQRRTVREIPLPSRPREVVRNVSPQQTPSDTAPAVAPPSTVGQRAYAEPRPEAQPVPEQPRRTAPAEIVRRAPADRTAHRAHHKKKPKKARVRDVAVRSPDVADPRDARAEVPRASERDDRRSSRRFDRRREHRERDPEDSSRRRERDRPPVAVRSVEREAQRREVEPRFEREPGSGFNPFRLFGMFDQR